MNVYINVCGCVMVLSAMTLAAGPTTAPALPSGHPDISAMQQTQNAPPLPSGHPDISALMKEAAAGKMPAGHPDIAKGSGTAVPSTRPFLPTLYIEAHQGTAGAPAVGADPVTIETYRDGQQISKIDTHLDANGKLTFGDLPAVVAFQPVVKITHAGAEYTVQGEQMDIDHNGQRLVLPVYEPTEVQPAWSIKIRHVMVSPQADGATVMEMMSIESPIDRVWVGQIGADGRRVSLSLPLPKGATDVKLLSGFEEGFVSVANDRVIDAAALMPGTTAMQLQYRVPAVSGVVDLTTSAPASIDRMMLFVPDDGSSTTAAGLESLGAKPNDRGGTTRYYKGQSIQAGSIVGVTLSKLPKTTKADGDVEGVATPTAAHLPGMGNMPQIVGGVGAVLILFVGAAILLKPKRT
ncbi:hypothetical protein BH10PLA1_BH10PLA1_06080 [soil metagenome]